MHSVPLLYVSSTVYIGVLYSLVMVKANLLHPGRVDCPMQDENYANAKTLCVEYRIPMDGGWMIYEQFYRMAGPR